MLSNDFYQGFVEGVEVFAQKLNQNISTEQIDDLYDAFEARMQEMLHSRNVAFVADNIIQ